MQLDAVSGDVGVPAFEPLPLKFLFDVGHLGFFVERGDQGEVEPATPGPRQLGVQLPLAEAHWGDQIQAGMRNPQRRQEALIHVDELLERKSAKDGY